MSNIELLFTECLIVKIVGVNSRQSEEQQMTQEVRVVSLYFVDIFDNNCKLY